MNATGPHAAGGSAKVTRPLAIFDIDGTLCDTVAVDAECFVAVASAMLQVPLGGSSWEGSPHITDSGIVDWWWRRYRGRAPSAPELHDFAAAFEAALSREWLQAPGRFAATPGASQFLQFLRGVGWDVGIATGGWGRTARFKLGAAGLPADLLLASSDDSPDRIEIFRLAQLRAAAASPTLHSPTVLVGDGVWDVRVAAQMGWPFLGVGRADRGARLRLAGAATIVDDFSDGITALRLLQECAVPTVAIANSSPRAQA